jgi:hypothetical protein
MHIRMLKTAGGSTDGIRVKSYDEGQEYDLSGTAGARELAESFVGADLAEEVGAKPSAASVGVAVGGDEGAAPAAVDEAPAIPAKPGRKPKAQ